MTAVFRMTQRNLLLFFRDRASVFFSVLGALVVIGLYVLFLGNMMVRGMTDVLGGETRFIMDSWIMAGVIAVASITTTMGAYGTMVDDRKLKIAKDFSCTPVTRGTLASGYMLSAVVIGILMCSLNLALAEIYIALQGGRLLPPLQLLEMLGAIVLAVLANSAIVLFVTTFFKSSNAFATASTILGTLIGFLTGCYIPIGDLPSTVQWVIKCFPPAHASALMRRIMMEGALEGAMEGAPAQVVASVRQMLGLEYQYGEWLAGPSFSIWVLVGTAVVFYILSAMMLARKREN